MFDNILVPLDGSPFGERSLPAAARLARRTGAALHIVHVHEARVGPVYPDGVPAFDSRWDTALREQELEYLRSVSARCMEEHGIAPRTELLDGAVASAISRHAGDIGADLVMMTTHGRGGISRAWVGSVADALVRSIGVPVMLLRPNGEAVEPAAESQSLLVPLDGSALAEGIIDPAVELASVTGAKLTLLRVVLPIPFVVGPAAPAVPVFDPEAAAQLQERAGQYLDAMAARIRERGIDVRTDVISHSSPALAILDYAATHAIDGIAMATHGRGGWSRIALGSVADKVMRGSMLPMLLYRPAGARPAENQTIAAREEDATCITI
jgi:nucleotide-binding universal stress UspA family protein